MYKLIIVLALLNISVHVCSQNETVSITLPRLEIEQGNPCLSELLQKIADYERHLYGEKDTLLYEFLFSKTPEYLANTYKNYDHIYVTGVGQEWPVPKKSLTGIIGYIQIGNIFFLIHDGGGFPENFFSRIFSENKCDAKDFERNNHSEKVVTEDDDSVIRTWCHLLYKDDSFVVLESPWMKRN